LEILFVLYEDKIVDEIVSYLNEIQAGEIVISSAKFSPLSHFPDISVRLDDVQYYETKSEYREPGEEVFCKLDKFYISLDIMSLLKGDLDVSELTFQDGELRIIAREDSSVNIFNILNEQEDSAVRRDADDGEAIDLQLNKFTLENILLSYENQLSGYRADLHLHEFENSLTFMDQHLDIQLQPQIDIIRIEKDNRSYLENTQLEMLLNFRLDLDSLEGQIEKSRIIVQGANLDIQGVFALKEDYFLDLKITSAVDDLSLLLLIFDDELIKSNIENIQQGNIYFNGIIKGNLANKIPYAEIKFGINDLHLKIPNTQREIKNICFDGLFSTGTDQNLSGGILQFRNISSEGPAGRSTGSIQIRNFKQPEIEFSFNGNIDLSNIDRILKFVETPVYSGVARIKADAQTIFDNHTQKIKQKKGNIAVELEGLSFLIANTGQKCENLGGHIQWQNNKILVDDLTMRAEPTDILLSGEITNLVDHFLGFDSKITTKIKLEAGTLDLNTFLTNDDVGQWMLDEYCRNVDVDIEFTTDSKRLKQDSELPPGLLKFHNLRIDLKNVSDLEIQKGNVLINPEMLDIKNIQARIDENDVFFSSKIQNYKDLFANDFQNKCLISIELLSNKVRLKDFFTYKDENYLPEFWANNFYEDFHLDATLILPEDADSSITPEFEFDLDVGKLSCINPRTGIVLKEVSANVIDTGDDLIFRRIMGQIGQTKFETSNLYLVNLFSGDKKMQITCDIACNLLDMKEWLGYFLGVDTTSYTIDDHQLSQGAPYEITTIPTLNLKTNIEEFRYGDISLQNLRTSILTQKENHLHIDTADSTWWIPDIDLTAQIDADSFKTPFFNVPETQNKVITKDDILEVFPSYRGMFDAEGSGHIWLDMSKKRHSYRIQYSINNFKLETFLSRFEQEQRMSGIVHMSLDLRMDEEDLAKLNGEVLLGGKDLTVFNIDIDEVLTKFKRTQNFNLVDIGAFVLAGPAGTLATKATDYASLLNIDPTKQSTIREFLSSWRVNGGVVMADDVAFITDNSRIALTGGVDLYKSEILDFTLGVVDKKGCSLISQTISGSFSEPQLEQVNAASTIIAPVTNVLKMIAGVDCKPFYTGSLAHPK
jgi:uncharacterized protein involved in outer membrane biogenesis